MTGVAHVITTRRMFAMAKHIKNYAKAKKILKSYLDSEQLKAEKHLAVVTEVFGNPKCWDAEHNCYRLTADTAWSSKGSVVIEEDVAKAKEHLKWLARYRERCEQRLERADKADKVIEINISVTWSRSRTWGYNPHAEVWLFVEDKECGGVTVYGEGRASGCGYDKRSAAVDEALGFPVKKKATEREKANSARGIASLDRFVIEHGEELWKEYAIDRTPFPHLCFGGKGMSTFVRLFRRIGCKPYGAPIADYLIDYHESDKGADTYHIIRKDRV